MITLGLDIGTNSIGWAIVNKEREEILGMGTRIIPMGAELSKFEQGQAQTKNAKRRIARGSRKLNKRYKQRRNKLIYVLQQLNMLPEQIKLSEPFSSPYKIDKVSILPISRNQPQYSALDFLELRVKALREKISLQELGKLIYWFNQLRGYSGGSNEPEKDEDDDDAANEEKKGKEEFTVFCKVLEVSKPEKVVFKKRELKKVLAKIETEDGIIEGESFLEVLKPNESLELLVSVRRSKQGETITFKLPNKTNWRKKMENLEKELTELSRQEGREIYLSEYFLNIVRHKPWTRIRTNVVLRSRYQSEFDAIWKEQSKHHKCLDNLNKEKLSELLHFLFPGPNQEKFRQAGIQKGLHHVIRNQIIYYQRELKDQSQLIADCRFEPGQKAIAKSHPVFQEYKIWEQINKLTINTKIEAGLNKKGEMKYEYVDRPIPATLKEWLYDELQQKKEIGFGPILNKLRKEYGLRESVDFLNGINPKAKLRGNETRLQLKKALGDSLWKLLKLDDTSLQIRLWDILYNCKGNEYDIESERTSKVLSYLKEHAPDLPDIEQTAIQISKIKFARNYASISLKAIEKILPLARAGKYFNPTLSENLQEKIVRLLNETVDDPFEKAVQEFLDRNQTQVLSAGGIMNAYATILVYNRHTAKEYSANELVKHFHEIRRLPQGSLRNPLVEQVISETLILVRDIWKQYGVRPDAIHIELARELKNNAERRAKLYATNRENQKANDEVKDILLELKEEITPKNIEKYKLWLSQENLEEEFLKQYNDPSKSEIEKLRLWREQGHISPYTGQPIPLKELFNRELFDVDHIIPRSRYFDDSFTNKVISESKVNREKDNKTAMEYFEIGSSIPKVFTKSAYIEHVNKYFTGIKRKNLLATKIPEDPIRRQMKETQYISLKVREELNKIVGNDNVKTSTGGVTDYLRNQWGVTNIFKHLLKGRYMKLKEDLAKLEFEKYEKAYEKRKQEKEQMGMDFNEERMDEDTFRKVFYKTFVQKKNNQLVIKGWSKRIDYRHNAIDALIVACTEQKHVNQLNNLNKEIQSWLDKNRDKILPEFEGTPSELLDEILHLEASKRKAIFSQIEKFKNIEMPWKNFPEMVEKAIRRIIVSQKPKDKLLIQKGKNAGLQIKIRGQLHEKTLYGKSHGVEAYRVPLRKFAGKKFATEKAIEKIVNEYLKEEIDKHFKEYDKKKEDAFSADGILALNQKLAEKKDKDGKIVPHTPISSIKIYYRNPQKIKMRKDQEEPDEVLQRLDRSKAYNNSLYVKTGDNYLFAVMEKEGKRIFDLITLFDAASLLKEEFGNCNNKLVFDKERVFKKYFEEKNKARLLFTLIQGDPVYLPSKGEDIVLDINSPLYLTFWEDKESRSENVYYVTKFSGNRIYFNQHTIAYPIIKGKEFGSQNALEIVNGVSIKEQCIKLNIDRLGNLRPY